jgi:hypothetical protein
MALGATRLMSSMLFGLTTTDVATFAQVAAVVGLASLVACALPTLRLGRLEGRVTRTE